MADVMGLTAPHNQTIINATTLQMNPGGQQFQSVQTNVTAHSGGGQANGVPITAMAVFVSAVAVAGDSLTLPPALAGLQIEVINQSATATGPNIFPSPGQTINALSANTAIAVAPQTVLIFYCGVAGAWWTK